jgi:MFS family permease
MTADLPASVSANPPEERLDPVVSSALDDGDLPAALREPIIRVGNRWIGALFLAGLGVWMAFITPLQVLLPKQIESIDPNNKEVMLALVTGIGALAAVFANPLAGALSDRTTSRFGRRHPWTLGGAVLGAIALAALAMQQTILGVVIGWVAAQVCLNAMLAALTAAIPDRVPVAQRGEVSGWVGIPQVLGLVLGVLLVTAVVHTTESGYFVVAGSLVLLSLAFVLRTNDDPLAREHRQVRGFRSMVRGFWVSPRAYPDFGWAWITRFLVQLGSAFGVLYLYYYLKDGVRYPNPDRGLLILVLVYTAALMFTTVIAGVLSDRLGRRKLFVIVSGVVGGAAGVMLAMSQTFQTAIWAAGILGAGYGVYAAVDAALITQVLPAARDRAKDLGVVNIANSAPQVLAPAIAAPIVHSAGGYPLLYAITAAVTVIGALLVVNIKAVR